MMPRTENTFFKSIVIFSMILLVNSKNCPNILAELANEQMHFVHCVMVHSVPVTMCIDCMPEYKSVLKMYDLLSANCSDIYFDKDRINLIASTESALTGLWSKAYCDDCFNNNNSYVFNEKNDTFSKCVYAHKNESCEYCKEPYLDLNSFYINLDQHNNGEVCYDLQDSMNRTRDKWSQELKCCRRDRNLTLFMIVLGITSCLPLLFYGTTYCITKRQECYQRILSNEDPYYSDVTTASRQNVNAQNQSIIDSIPSTSNAATNNIAASNSLTAKKKIDISSNNEMDSSDDELQINLTIPSKEKIKNM